MDSTLYIAEMSKRINYESDDIPLQCKKSSIPCVYSVDNEHFPVLNASPEVNQCVDSCHSVKWCRDFFGNCSIESHFYTDNNGNCQMCHKSCRFFGCISGENGADGGCKIQTAADSFEEGCYEIIEATEGSTRHLFHGHKCSEKIEPCEQKCKHKYGCELDAKGNFIRKGFFSFLNS